MEPEKSNDPETMNSNYPVTRVLHDLKNPAGVIAGYADMLRRPHIAGNPEKVLHYADKIHFSSKLLMRLIDDLSRLQSSYTDFNTVKAIKVQTDRLIQSILEPYALRAARKDLSFSLRLATDLPRSLSIDALRLGQVLSNLLDNSIKYTDQGGIVIAIGYTYGIGRQGRLEITVTDSGCGIISEMRERIFEPYFRVTPSSPDLEGQGIGLASARMIAHQLGGSLHLLWSEVGQGCQFALSLPVSNSDISAVINHIDLAACSHDVAPKLAD